MNQEELMQQLENQWLDELNEEHWSEELKELKEQEEEENYMLWQASMYSY